MLEQNSKEEAPSQPLQGEFDSDSESRAFYAFLFYPCSSYFLLDLWRCLSQGLFLFRFTKKLLLLLSHLSHFFWEIENVKSQRMHDKRKRN